MQDEYYYSGSGFYEEQDANVNASFTDVSELQCSFPDCMRLRARRYGQWWTLTGVSPKCRNHGEAQQRLRTKYARVVTLNHPNITRVVAMVQTPLFTDECVIEEYIDGVPLDEFMQSDPEKALRLKLLDQVVDALQYSHSKGVVHGRLSPSTVMVTLQDHIAKLVDFGCEGELQDDVHALADIIDTLQLPPLGSVAESCRNGEILTIEEVRKVIERPRSHKWLRVLAFAAIMAILAIGAFWTGHRNAMVQDSRQADSLPLPGIYFSDAARLAAMNYTDSLFLFHSTLTGASLYFHNIESKTPGPITENVAVDLGLSVLWAPFNVGCDDAEINHVGGFYMWCDTLGYGRFAPVDQYWPVDRDMTDISGSKYDIVRRVWGGRWRMPTLEEWSELLYKSKWTLVRQQGIPPGYKVHGPNGNEIFLPLTGYRLRFRDHDLGVVGHYWSSTPVDGDDRLAHAIKIDTTIVDLDEVMPLTHCLSIRPVLDKE